MSIRYWFPADEELNGASGIAIMDEDGGFVAGAMRCFAGVALAGVLAANTLAAQLPYAAGWQGDERMVPATLLVDETDYLLPTPVIAPLAVRAFADDDQYVSFASFFVERYEWPVVVGPPIVPRIVQAVTDDDQYVGYLGTDEDGQWRFVVSASPLVQAITDDSDFVVVAPSALEHGDWSPVVPLVPSRVVQAAADDDQYVGYLGTDEDGWLAPVPAQTPPVVAVTDDDQFVTSAAATFFVERYQWPLYTPPITTTGPVVAVTDDDQFAPLSTASFFVERYQWPLYTVPSTTASVVAVTDDDQFVGTQPFVLVQGSVGSGAWIPFAHARSLKITQRDILRATKRRKNAPVVVVPVVVVETPAVQPTIARVPVPFVEPTSTPRLAPHPIGLDLTAHTAYAGPAAARAAQHAARAVEAERVRHEHDEQRAHAQAVIAQADRAHREELARQHAMAVERDRQDDEDTALILLLESMER